MNTLSSLGMVALTGVTLLAITPADAHAQACAARTKVMFCGGTNRARTDIFSNAPGLTIVSGCTPDGDTKAMLVSRGGAPSATPAWLSYLSNGGVIITEAISTHIVYNNLYGTAFGTGSIRGACYDNAMPSVKLNTAHPFWQANTGLTPPPSASAGCGYDLQPIVTAEGLTSLGARDDGSISFALKEEGAGLLYLLEADWRDQEADDRYTDDSRAFMDALITSCNQCTSNADCSAGEVCDLLGSNTCEPVNTCGNGTLEAGEGCDDGGVAAGDGCSATCLIEDGQACTTSAQCATGFCDPDGNICACDGDEDCSAGFVCDTTLSPNACQPAINYSLAISTPVDGAFLNNATPTITGTTEANLTVTVTIDGALAGTATADGAGAWTFTPAAALADGAHTVSVSVDDGLGNTANAGPTSFTIDTILPDTEIVSPAQGAYVNTNALTISGISEPGASVAVFIDGNSLGTVTADASGDWSIPVSALTEGLHTITAQATDAAGNSVFALAKEFTVDTIAPVTAITTPVDGTLTNTTFTITGTTEANATVTVQLDGAPIGTITADAAGDWSLALPATADGPHTISATGEDLAGNVGAAATAGFVLDTTPPAPAFTAPAQGGFVNTNAPTLSGTTEPNATVEVSVDGNVLGTVTADAAGVWSIAASGLADGAHTATATSTDLAGNTGVAPALTFTVDTVAPTPTIDAPAANAALNTATPTFSGTTEPNATVTVTVDGNVLGTVTADAAGAWTLIIVNALPEGAHTVEVTSADAAGNTGSAGPSAFSTDTIAPAPVVVQPAPGSYTGNRTPMIGGTTEADASVSVTVRDAQGVEIETLTTTADLATGAWTVNMTASLPDGAYTIEVTSVDAVGNSGSTTSAFNVDATLLPITIDSPAMGEATSEDRPEITGTTAPNTAVEIIISDDQGAEVEALTATSDASGDWTTRPTADLAEGDYTVDATVANLAGLESSASSTFTIDQTGPAVTLTSPANGDVIGEQAPTFEGTSEPGATITVVLTDEAGNPVETLTATTDANGSWSVTPSSPLTDGATTAAVTATDAAGNETDLPAITITVDTVAPTTTVTSPADGGVSTDATPTITGTGEPGATVEVSIDGVVVNTTTVREDGTWSVTPDADLSEGDHTIDVNSTDAAGNMADTTSLSFTVDTIPPTIAITSPVEASVISELPTTIRGTSEPGATVEVFLDGVSIGTVTTDASGDWSLEQAELSEGKHTVKAVATDANGLSIRSPEIAFTLDFSSSTGNMLAGDGCGCGTSPTRGPDGTLGLWALALGGVLLRRRRR